ncbi:MAG: aldo/keto reductase [Acidobacteria bacterium]|nr:aldo/keto reductase [Acidobacteriota bacterium]
MTFGSQVTPTDAHRMVDKWLDAGLNFIDTANVYNDGLAEQITGDCLKGRRDKVVLASKVRGAMGDPVRYEGLSAKAMRTSVEESLSRLQTDYLDLLYLHMPDPATPIEETLETLSALQREGKVRYGATSNYAAWQVCEMFSLCDRNGWPYPAVSQPMYNALARGIEQEYIPFARKFGVSLVVYNPLAGGLLTGKQSLQTGPIAGTRFDGNERYLDRYWHPGYFKAVEEMKKISANYGRSIIEIALRWLLDHEIVDSVILGASRMEHLEANIAAAESAPLTREILDACDVVWDELRGPTPFYNR